VTVDDGARVVDRFVRGVKATQASQLQRG